MSNIHEQIDRFASLSPRRKVVIAATVLLIIAVLFAAVFWLGTQQGQEWSDSKYLRERDERMKVIAGHEEQAKRHVENEKQLAAENALLRKQTEAADEILTGNDDKLKGDTKKFTELLEKRNEKLKTIDADNDFDSQLCGLCADSQSAGFRLSDDLCGRCQTDPPDRR